MAASSTAGIPELRPELDAQRLTSALSSTENVSAWQLSLRRDEEAQLYLIGEREESRRVVTTETARAVVYHDHDAHGEGASEGRARGFTPITLLPADVEDPARLTARLQRATEIASMTDNPPWTLPAPSGNKLPHPPLVDAAIAADPAHALEGALDRLRAAVETERNVRLSSAELFARRAGLHQQTSAGFAGYYSRTLAELDLVLIASGRGGAEAEFHVETTLCRLADMDFAAIVATYATFARDSLRAKLPATAAGPVILSGNALRGLWGPLIVHTSGQAAFQGISRLKAGESVTPQPPRGDRLTFTSDPLRPFGVQSVPFDADGLPARRATLIENGVFTRPWADARYASYLHCEPTGPFANPTVAPGTSTIRELRQPDGAPVYEIVEFSWMNPDRVTGHFVSEIKLGYRHDAQGTTPIKGGALSGNLFEALADARFSSEVFSDGAYSGPAAIRFGNLTITGE